MDFSEIILIYDIKVGRCSQLNYNMNLYEYQRSRSFTDLGPDLSDLIFLNFFSSITTRPNEAKFHVEPPSNGGTKASSNSPGQDRCNTHIWGGKTFKTLLLWNLKVGDLET